MMICTCDHSVKTTSSKRNLTSKMVTSTSVVCLVWMATISCSFVSASLPTFPYSSEHMKNYSDGMHYYRTFTLDPTTDTLYVGAMNRIYRLNLADITDEGRNFAKTQSVALHPSQTDVIRCRPPGKDFSQEFECQNHIRVIQKRRDGRLYVCGTGSYNPKDYTFSTNLQSYVPFGPDGDGVAKCPPDPKDESTAVWVEHGNPEGIPTLYSATTADISKAENVIFRPPLYRNGSSDRPAYPYITTSRSNSKWLSEPNFVGSFDVGNYVYFFFRETAVEYMNCGKSVYSRVARVCKRDTGGQNVLMQNWATFLKARLNCSIPGEFPFYFDEIRDVYAFPKSNRKFFAVFSTNQNGLMGSAVCAFDMTEIEAAFNGRFKEQVDSGSAWLPVRDQDVPSPRPGECHDYTDTRRLPDVSLTFIQSHPLMDASVRHEYGQPVFYRRDVLFTHIVVDSVRAMDNQDYLVYFLATDRGTVYKLVEWQDHTGRVKSHVIGVYEVAGSDGQPIRALEISAKHRSLYVGTDSGVVQVSTSQCDRHDLCMTCARDPYCGWDLAKQRCRIASTTQPLLQSLESEDKRCQSEVTVNQPEPLPLRHIPGQTVYLPCDVPDYLRKDPNVDRYVQWYHDDQQIHTDDRTLLTADMGLVMLHINSTQRGPYRCRVKKQTVTRYEIHVDTVACKSPNSVEGYNAKYQEWCKEFERYKSEMDNWQTIKQKKRKTT